MPLLIPKTLTVAGVKLCLSIGVANPTLASCEKAFTARVLPIDSYGDDGPVVMLSAHDSPNPNDVVGARNCIEWAVWADEKGQAGAYFCTQDMEFIGERGTARWRWVRKENGK